MDTLEKLKSLNQPVPQPSKLPSERDVKLVEDKLGVKFPPSYVKFLLKYSDVNVGTFEPYSVFQDNSYLDIIEGITNAREAYDLPENLIPFLEDNGNYYCFDLDSKGPEHSIVFWSPYGISSEKWNSFLDWIDRCWIGENIK